MNQEPSDLFYHCCGTFADEGFDHLPDRQLEWYESTDMATKEYSLQRLQGNNITLDQTARFIDLKHHLEFVDTYQSIWCDG